MPLVQTNSTGRRVCLANPSAKKAAERSSNTGTASTPGWRTNAMVNGVERDPGETTACVTPRLTSVSTSTLHHKVLVFRKSKGVIPAHPAASAFNLNPRIHPASSNLLGYSTPGFYAQKIPIFPIANPLCALLR